MDNYQHLKSLQSTRKRFEQMNQTLISRVSFLESEDIKARKMIEETKKQAAKLSKSKTQHLEEQKTLETLRMKQEETLLAKMSQIQIKKTLARENAEKNLQAILKKKKELIFSTRNFKENNKKEAILRNEISKKTNKKIIMEIKESELKTFDKKERIKEEKALRNQQEFGDKLMEETENLEDQERLLLYLENKEVSLMEQLKNTQFLQKKAYEDFVINN